MDWRDELKKVMANRPPREPERHRQRIDVVRAEVAQFITDTVMPAFDELKRELESYGRTVQVDRRQYGAAMHVFKGGREEFSYAIRGHVHHTMTFAYPEIGKADEPCVARAELRPKQGGTRDYELEKLSREKIIRDFLDEYSNWVQ